MRDVKIIDKKFQTSKLQNEIEDDLFKQKKQLKVGHMPKYLVRFN